MTLHDSRGEPVSLGRADALAGYERALELALGYRADPVAEIDAVLAGHPDFVMGHVLRATLHALAMERGALPVVAQAIAAAEATGLANPRERGHLAALAAWHDGDWAKAVRRWGDVLADHPRDALALFAAHVGDFFLGWPQMLRDHPARVLQHWDESTPGYGHVLGMHAFGLEECGEYARAEETGMRALEVDPRDAWAVHAVAHVMEMEGRPAEGAAFLAAREDDWAPESQFAFHLRWHDALFRLELDDAAGALALYDEAIRPRQGAPAIELVDATSL